MRHLNRLGTVDLFAKLILVYRDEFIKNFVRNKHPERMRDIRVRR